MPEQVSDAASSSTTGQKAVAIVGGTVVVGLFATATVFTGIYAFNNPDPDRCWVIRDLESTARTKAEAIATANAVGIEIPEGYPVDMAGIYVTWFLWGFYAKVAIASLMVVAAGVYMAAEQAGIITAGISCGLYLSNMIVWLAAGGIWRFSKAGITASGDRLEREQGVTDEEWAAQRESARVRQGY